MTPLTASIAPTVPFELGVRAFRDALSASGLAPGERARITVELAPVGDTVAA